MITENTLEIYRDKFEVLECQTEDIEMYQIKMFYYQSVPGLQSFRFSMSQNKSYLYYKNNNFLSLSQLIIQGVTLKEVYRILEQIKGIFDLSQKYLLYSENIQLNPSLIKISKEKTELSVECMYIPLKKQKQKKNNEDYEQLIGVLARVLNELNHMEGYYYFSRVYQDIKDGNDGLGFYKHLEYFLQMNRNKNV